MPQNFRPIWPQLEGCHIQKSGKIKGCVQRIKSIHLIFYLKSFEKCYIFFEFADELVSENGHLLKAENMASSHVIRLFTIQTPIPRRCSYSLEAKFSSISDADRFDFA